MALRERLTTLVESASERAGIAVVDPQRLEILEARSDELGATRRELDALGWTVLNNYGSSPQDLKPEERLTIVRKARRVWEKDPQAGAAVEMMNEFVFGQGIPKPKAKDSLVQEVIDEAWEDPDNEDALTGREAQETLGTDLELQSNIFFLFFDDGDDGKVKLAILDHDTVFGVVRDTEYRRKILYFKAKEMEDDAIEEDYARGEPKLDLRRSNVDSKTVYYPHWRNVDQVRKDWDEGLRSKRPNLIDVEPGADISNVTRFGEGRVYHVSINRTGERAFGHPRFDRLIGWYNAYNRFMDARVDIMEASAAFVMKRKVKGTPNQVQRMATQAISRRGAFGASVDPASGEELGTGPKAAAVLTENEEVTHEDFNLKTNGAEAAEDARMLRAQISAATRFPPGYYGDPGATSLATATSLELPVLKAVEKRQEVVEGIVRFFIDRVIERAVEAERIPTDLTEEERAELQRKKNPEAQSGAPPLPGALPGAVAGPPAAANGGPPPLSLSEYEDEQVDEDATERDLSYQFSMPNPLKRMLTDLISAIMNIARTFDPNNTNMELSRALLTIALGEGLEVEDPAQLVDAIFPEGYVDPAVMAAQAQMAGMGEEAPADPMFGEFAPTATGPDGQQHGAGNPYGAPMKSTPPEKVVQESMWPRDRFGEPVSPRILREVRFEDLPDRVKARAAVRNRELDSDFESAVGGTVGALLGTSTNGGTHAA